MNLLRLCLYATMLAVWSLGVCVAASPPEKPYEKTLQRVARTVKEKESTASTEKPKKKSNAWQNVLIVVLAVCTIAALLYQQRQQGGARPREVVPATEVAPEADADVVSIIPRLEGVSGERLPVPVPLADALQSSMHLTTWFEAGVRAQANDLVPLPQTCMQFIHGVDRCVRASQVELPPLVKGMPQVPIAYHNAVIARLATLAERPLHLVPAAESPLPEQLGVAVDQCSIWRFCELVAEHLSAPANKEAAGSACADALLQLTARIRHDGDVRAAGEELLLWLRTAYPQRTRGYSDERRAAALAALTNF